MVFTTRGRFGCFNCLCFCGWFAVWLVYLLRLGVGVVFGFPFVCVCLVISVCCWCVCLLGWFLLWPLGAVSGWCLICLTFAIGFAFAYLWFGLSVVCWFSFGLFVGFGVDLSFVLFGLLLVGYLYLVGVLN